MRRFRNATTGACILAAATWLGPSAALADRVEVDWWHAMPGQLGETLEEVVQRFNESQDKYQVNPVFKGFYTEVLNAAIAAYRAGDPPHFIQTHEPTVLTMMTSGAIVPVEDLFAERGYDVDFSKFLPPVHSWYATPEGKLLSMPFNTSTGIIFWNKELYEKAGLDPQKPAQTWDEVGDHAAALRDAGVCGFATTGSLWTHVEGYSFIQDIPVGTQANGYTGLDAELLINTTRVVDHLDRLQSWLKDGRAVVGGREAEAPSALFVIGECGIIFNSTAWQGTLERDAKFNWGVAPAPHEADVENPQLANIGGATLWVLKGHEREEYDAVAAFFNFLTDPDIQIFWHKSTGYVPITMEAYEKAKAEGYYNEKPGREVPIIQLSRAQPTDNSRGMRFGDYAQVRDIITEEIENILSLEKTAQEAMDDAVRRGNEVLRRFERRVGG
jgi:sn-glycerol 3-phosphate transport system substrate-binding protein